MERTTPAPRSVGETSRVSHLLLVPWYNKYLVRIRDGTFVTEDGIGFARQGARGTGQVGVADARGVDLNQDFVGLDRVEVDLAQLELSVQFGDDEGGCAAGHRDGGVIVFVVG